MDSSMLTDFEKMLAKSKRDQFLWAALSVAINWIVVLAWPVARGPIDTPAEIALLFVRGLLPAVLCLGILLVMATLHFRMEALLQRGLNEQPSAQIIAQTSNLRPGDAKRLAADLLWLRAVFADDQLARTYLAGQDGQDHPATQSIPYDDLAAQRRHSQSRRLTIVLLAFGLCIVSTFLLKTFEFAATHGSSVRLSITAALGLQAVGILSVVGLTGYHLFEAHLEQQEGKKPFPQLMESWLNGSERAGKALRHRARTHPELREIAERCGWRTRSD